jgi:hypothetical protein
MSLLHLVRDWSPARHAFAAITASPRRGLMADLPPLLAPGASDYTAKQVVRGGVEPPTFRFSGGRSYQLSYLTGAVLTGFEPATSTLTGWRALRAALQDLAVLTAALPLLHCLGQTAHCIICAAQPLLPTGVSSCQPEPTQSTDLRRQYPQRDSNPRRRLERAVSLAARRWGLDGQQPPLPVAPAVGDRLSIGDGWHCRQSG